MMSMCLLPFSTGGGTGSSSVVVTFALPFLVFLCTFIIYNFFSKRERTNYPREFKASIFCALLHIFAIFLSSLMNQNLASAFARSIFHLFGFIIFLYITSNASVNRNAVLVYNKVALMMVSSGFVMSGYFIVNFALAIQQKSFEQVLLERSNGGLMSLPWGASNSIAACLMMPFFLGLDRVVNLKPIKKTDRSFTIFMMVIMIIAIILTQSRNVIITLVIGLLGISLLTGNKKPVFIFVGLVAMIVVPVVTFYSQDLEFIFATRIGDQSDNLEGFNGRTIIWEESISYFTNHPFQPLGYFGMLEEIGHTSHNVFMTTLIEQGIIGLLLYVLFLFNNFAFCIKKMSVKYLSLITRRRTMLYLVAMLSIFIQYQFEDSNLTAQNIIYQWIFLALMYLHVYCDTYYADPVMQMQLPMLSQQK
jgi:O-antigen ligase